MSRDMNKCVNMTVNLTPIEDPFLVQNSEKVGVVCQQIVYPPKVFTNNLLTYGSRKVCMFVCQLYRK